MKPETDRTILSILLGLIIVFIIADALILFYLSQPKFIMTDSTTQTDRILSLDRNLSHNNLTEPVDLLISAPTTTVTSNTHIKHLEEAVSTTTTTIIPNCGGPFESPCKGGECELGFKVGSRGVCQPVVRGHSAPNGREGCGGFALF